MHPHKHWTRPADSAARNQKQLVFEMRIWSKNLPHHCDTGIEFYGTEGMLFVSKRGKLEAWDESNQSIPIPAAQVGHDLPKTHAYDFLESIALQRKPAAEIAIGHDSCCLVHLANISLRTGRTLHLD